MDDTVAVLFFATIFIGCLAGWITNVIWTFGQQAVIDVILGLVGIFCFPVGIVHGIYLWF